MVVVVGVVMAALDASALTPRDPSARIHSPVLFLYLTVVRAAPPQDEICVHLWMGRKKEGNETTQQRKTLSRGTCWAQEEIRERESERARKVCA